MNDNLLRKAVDARLSGLTFTPQMQADTLRRAHPAGSTRMGRKLSYSLAFALLALLLAATAGAAAYFGVLHFHGEQENNAVYQRHILPIGERLTGQNTTVTVNDAVFDGSFLSFSLDIAHVPNTPEVYLYPRVTATQDGRVIATHVTEFQQLSADESYGLSASLSGFGLYEGIFMPARGIGKAEQGYYSLDVSLLEALPHPEKPVEWSLTFDVLHPVFALEDAPYTVTEEEDGGVSYTWNTAMEDCLNAYREGRILIDSVGFLMDYAFALPAPDGMTAAQWEQADLGTRLTASGAFSLSEQLTARFVTDGAPIASIQSPQTFSVGDTGILLDIQMPGEEMENDSAKAVVTAYTVNRQKTSAEGSYTIYSLSDEKPEKDMFGADRYKINKLVTVGTFITGDEISPVVSVSYTHLTLPTT